MGEIAGKTELNRANWIHINFPILIKNSLLIKLVGYLFTKLSINTEIYTKLKMLNLSICLVSPELHDINRVNEIDTYKKYLVDNNIKVDAICTKLKNIKKW